MDRPLDIKDLVSSRPPSKDLTSSRAIASAMKALQQKIKHYQQENSRIFSEKLSQ